MALTPLPDPPQTADPANFATKADALVAALATMVTEINSGAIEYTGGIMTSLVTANAGIALPSGQTLSGAGAIAVTGSITGASKISTGTAYVGEVVSNGGTLDIAIPTSGSLFVSAASEDQGIAGSAIAHDRNGTKQIDAVGTINGCTLTISGTNARFTNTSGFTATVNFSGIRMN